MIIQRAGASFAAGGLPSYYGTKAATDEVIGVGQDGIFVVGDSLQILTYDAALQSGSLAELRSSSRPSSFGYSETLRQIEVLAGDQERDSLGQIRPSETGVAAARETLFRMLKSAVEIPVPVDVGTDRDGDIRVLWEDGSRALELVCPYEPDQRSYIYYSEGTEYAIAFDLSVYRLGRLLAWLAGSSQNFPR